VEGSYASSGTWRWILARAAMEGAIGIARWRELRESPCAGSRPHPQARVRTGRQKSLWGL